MNIKNKGFTLVELLAVIVILSALVLITSPIVINMTEKSESDALLISAELYLDSVKQVLMNKNLQEKGAFEPIACDVVSEGSLICNDNIELELDVDGQLPTSGKIKFKEYNIISVKLNYGEETIIKNRAGDLIYFENEYEIGQSINYLGTNGYVIDETEDSVIILTNNAYSCQIDSGYVLKNILEDLNNKFSSRDDVEIISNYFYVNAPANTNFGYQNLEIKKGKTKITDEDGVTEIDVAGTTKARIITLEEIFEIAIALNQNLTIQNLKSYVERNFTSILAYYNLSSISTIDELLIALKNNGFDYGSYYRNLYVIVLESVGRGMESFDLSFPIWLCDNNIGNYNNFIITSLNSYDSGLFLSSNCQITTSSTTQNQVNNTYYYRPIITVSKDKIQ